MYTNAYIVRGAELTIGHFDLYSSFSYPAPHILCIQLSFRHSLAPLRTISYMTGYLHTIVLLLTLISFIEDNRTSKLSLIITVVIKWFLYIAIQ